MTHHGSQGGPGSRRARPRAWASPIVLAVAVLLVGLASPGDAQPGAHGAAAARAAPARPAATGPGIPPVPADFGQDDQITFDPITPSVSKAKVQFSLGNLTLRTTLFECLTSVGFSYPDPCPIYDVSTLPFNKDPNEFWVAARTLSWVVSSPGPKPTYGRFPPVRVSALAFGSIPVSATVQLVQTVHHNLYDPLVLNLVTLGSSSQPGAIVYPGYGRTPDFSPYQTAFQLPFKITGDIEVRLSDVTVDQVPVPVGARCRTARPAHLSLGGPGGFYPQDNAPQKHRDRPGGFLPLNSELNPDGSLAPAGWIDGTVDIPPFSGCRSVTRSGVENLDPLLTGLISGPGNPVSAYANHALDLWCNSPLAHCPVQAAAEQRAALALVRTAGRSSDVARVKRAVARLRALQSAAPPGRISGPRVGH